MVLVSVCTLPCYRFKFFNLWVAFLLGLFWMTLHVSWQNLWSLPSNLEGIPLLTTGYIHSIPEIQSGTTHFIFNIQRFENSSIHRMHSGLVRCSWKNAPVLRVGEKWQLFIKLKNPHSPLNPGGFDYEGWLFSHGIRAIGSVVQHPANVKFDEFAFRNSMDRLRQQLAERTEFILYKSEYKGLIKALLVGEQSGILDEQWKVLRQTGTNHLFAIAGLHIGFVCRLVYLLVNACSRYSTRLMLSFSAPLLSAFSALITGIFYSALAGFSLPTKRAVIMLSVFLIAKIRKYNVSAWHSLSIALGILLLLNPLQILTESFWLSFTAVGSLIYGFDGKIDFATETMEKACA